MRLERRDLDNTTNEEVVSNFYRLISFECLVPPKSFSVAQRRRVFVVGPYSGCTGSGSLTVFSWVARYTSTGSSLTFIVTPERVG